MLTASDLYSYGLYSHGLYTYGLYTYILMAYIVMAYAQINNGPGPRIRLVEVASGHVEVARSVLPVLRLDEMVGYQRV